MNYFVEISKGLLTKPLNLKDGYYKATFVNAQTRSSQANSYYWVICKLIGKELGYSKDDMHQVLKQKFLSEEININGELFILTKSTASLTKDEFQEYLLNIEIFANELGIEL